MAAERNSASPVNFAPMQFYNPNSGIEKTHHRLPHWQQDEVAVFVTFRLADSMPKEVLEPWLAQRAAFLEANPPPWDEAIEAIYQAQFSDKLDDYLDGGHGCCALAKPAVARLVTDRLHHFNHQRYTLWSYVLMPNHAHVLFSLNENTALSDTLQSWKGVSSRLIHKSGLSDLDPFWQPDYFDRLVRSQAHFDTIRGYIRDNPMKAKLKPGTFTLWERS